MKLHDILHELVDAVATFTDNHRAEIHAGIDELEKLEKLAHNELPAPTPEPAADVVVVPAETPATSAVAPVSPAQ